MKLLIIEDDVFLRQSLKDVFKTLFESVITASRFSDFKNITIKDTDVALVDLGLPPNADSYEEGIKAIEYIKNSSNAKIIVFTGQESDEAAVESIGLGVFDYITKPAEIEEIINTVKKAMFLKEYEKKAFQKGKFTLEINVDKKEDFKEIREKAEKKYLENLLNIHGFNISRLAKELKTTREKIYYYLRKFGLK